MVSIWGTGFMYNAINTFYTHYEGLYLADQKSRKLGVLGLKLEGRLSPNHCYIDTF